MRTRLAGQAPTTTSDAGPVGASRGWLISCRRLALAALAALCLSALAGAVPASASASTLYVAASAPSDPSCAAASQANPFKTIAGALACASSGATIKIGAGTFAGGFTIARNAILQGTGAATVISDPSAATQSVTEVTVANGRTVTLSNLTVNGDGAQSDVVVGSGSLTVSIARSRGVWARRLAGSP